MDEDVVKRLEARLTRLEAAVAQQPSAGATQGIPTSPVSDPAPWGGPYYPWPWYRWPWPHPIGDPAPMPGTIVDQAPFRDVGSLMARLIPQRGDPAPVDLGRFTRTQLEGALHTISTEKARLESLEALVKQQMGRLG